MVTLPRIDFGSTPMALLVVMLLPSGEFQCAFAIVTFPLVAG